MTTRRGQSSAMILAAFFGWAAISLSAPASGPAPQFSPEAIARQRVTLYLQAAHQPLDKLSAAIDSFAAASERCRLASGAKACGLSEAPLPGGGVQQVFDYYVKGPVEERLSAQKAAAHKSSWNWTGKPNPSK